MSYLIVTENIMGDPPTILYSYKPTEDITPFQLAEIVPFLIKASLSGRLYEAFVGEKITGDLFDKLSPESKRHFVK